MMKNMNVCKNNDVCYTSSRTLEALELVYQLGLATNTTLPVI